MKTLPILLISALSVSQGYAYNLPKQPTKSYECDVCDQLSHEVLQDKWEISSQSLGTKVSNAQRSYSYKTQVSAEQLQTGFVISTLAPGAVVRIVPLGNKLVPQLTIKTPSDKIMALNDASAIYSQDETFGDPSLSTKHQTMMQIKPELGSGKFTIKTDKFNKEDALSYQVSVFDKFSSTYLQVETDSIHYQYGDKVTTIITLNNAYADYDASEVSAVLMGPAGQSIQLEVTELKKNQFEASTIMNAIDNDHGENWYVEVTLQTTYDDEFINRSGHAAFSYSVPSASMVGIKKLSSEPLTFVAALDIATNSRYAIQGVLFAKNADGEAQPIETVQKAQWLEQGKQVIQFTFDNSSHLSDDNLYIGYLRLIDYGQLKTVYQYNQPIKLTQLVE